MLNRNIGGNNRNSIISPNGSAVALVPPGPEAAYGPLHQLPGGGAEGGGPRAGPQPHLLRVGQGGAQLPHAASTGHARDR